MNPYPKPSKSYTLNPTQVSDHLQGQKEGPLMRTPRYITLITATIYPLRVPPFALETPLSHRGGPGAPAFLYVREDLQARLDNPISGWFGHRKQFYFNTEFEPASGIDRYLTGTPSVLSLAMIEPGVDLALEAGVEPARAKSLSQSEYLVALWASELAPLGFTLNSPRNSARRGSHVSFGHAEGLKLFSF